MTFGAEDTGQEQQQTATTDPEQQTPDAGQQQAEPEFKLHPAWESTLEVVPEILRPRIIEQIKTTEREHQKAIETARGTDVTPEFRELAQVAAQNGVSPEELVEAYNGHIALQEQLSSDPWGFLDGITEMLQQMVDNGTITQRQANAARADAAQQAQQSSDMLTDEQRELAELRARQDRWEQQQDQAQQAAQQQQIQQQADEYGRGFVQAIHDKFNADPALKAASNETRFTVGQVAAAILDGDASGRITFQQAIDTAIDRMKGSATLWGGGGSPAPQRTTSQGVPVGGGNGQSLPQPHTGFANDDERSAAMLAEAQRMLAAGE